MTSPTHWRLEVSYYKDDFMIQWATTLQRLTLRSPSQKSVWMLTHGVSENGRSGSSLAHWILVVDRMPRATAFILPDNFLREVLGL